MKSYLEPLRFRLGSSEFKIEFFKYQTVAATFKTVLARINLQFPTVQVVSLKS